MENPTAVLATRENFGRIYECECGCIHLQVGPVNLSLSQDAYMQLVDLVNTSASNYVLTSSDYHAS